MDLLGLVDGDAGDSSENSDVDGFAVHDLDSADAVLDNQVYVLGSTGDD